MLGGDGEAACKQPLGPGGRRGSQGTPHRLKNWDSNCFPSLQGSPSQALTPLTPGAPRLPRHSSLSCPDHSRRGLCLQNKELLLIQEPSALPRPFSIFCWRRPPFLPFVLPPVHTPRGRQRGLFANRIMSLSCRKPFNGSPLPLG